MPQAPAYAHTSRKPSPKAHDKEKKTTGFVPNVGQFVPETRFQAGIDGGLLRFNERGIDIDVFERKPKKVATPVDVPLATPDGQQAEDTPAMPTTIALRFDGANAAALPQAEQQGDEVISYFIGNDPAQWHPRVPVFSSIVYPDLFPGIDLRYDDTGRQIKGTYTVNPQRDPNVIGWHYEGIQSLTIDQKTGDLLITLPDGKTTLSELAPVAWQERDGAQVPVTIDYTLGADNTVRFALAVGAYDPTLPLVIDPTIVFSGYTYGAQGSSNYDENTSVAVDAQGNSYVASKSYITGANRGYDAVLTKYTANGIREFTAVIGGTANDSATGVAVDGQGNVYLAGDTVSTDFVVPGDSTNVKTYHAVAAGSADGFVVKLNPAASQILFSTYFGGVNYDTITGIAVDSNGRIAITGSTNYPHPSFPLRNGISTPGFNGTTLFVAELNPAVTGDSALIYSTLLGASSYIYSPGNNTLAVDSTGAIYVIGQTATTFRTKNAYIATPPGGDDVVVVKINPAAVGEPSYIYGTYLGSTTTDQPSAIAVDSTGSAYVTGYTDGQTTSFPLKASLKPLVRYTTNAFVTKFTPAGNGIVYSTLLNGTYRSEGGGIAVDSGGAAFVTGVTKSSDFPVRDQLFSYTGSAGSDDNAFVSKLIWNSSTQQLGYGYSTYIGQGRGKAIAVDANGTVAVVGTTSGTPYWPVVNSTTPVVTNQDAGFVMRLNQTPEPLPVVFVPGTQASFLDGERYSCGGTTGCQYAASNLWPAPLSSKYPLSLFTDDTTNSDPARRAARNVIATDVFRTIAANPIDPLLIYTPVLERLGNNGYREYSVAALPARRTSAGCDVTNQWRNRPSLFVMAYDWRQDNAMAALALKDYISCVQKFYQSGKKVNIVAHSMGGLVARRYILDNATSYVQGLVSIATPWLGAPETIFAMGTGYNVPSAKPLGIPIYGLVTPPELKYLTGSFTGVHQLLPSNAYQTLAGTVLTDARSGTAQPMSFTQYRTYMNSTFGFSSAGTHQFLPGTAMNTFHTYATTRGSMDDWRNDTTDVRYYVLFGKQVGSYRASTIGTVKLTSTGMVTTTVDGDGNVPLISAARIGNGLDYNKPNVRCSLSETHVFNLADRCQMITANEDGFHVGILKTEATFIALLAYLADSR